MTFCFIQAVERSGPGATYGTILTSMRSAIKNAGSGGSGGGDVVTSLVSMLLTGGSLTTGGLRQVNIQFKLSDHFADPKFELFPFYEMFNDHRSLVHHLQFFTSFVSIRFLILI